jgi:hypothetical protein
MNTPLDVVRRRLGLRGTRSSSRQEYRTQSATTATPGLGDVLQVNDYPVETLSRGTRRLLGVTTALSGIVALTHQLLTGALGAAHAAGVLGAVHALLSWPAPLAQPILAGIAALVLCVIGVDAHGWRRVSQRQSWYLLVFTVVAVLGAGPMVLVCALAVVTVGLILALCFMIFVGLLALLLVTR